MKTLRFHSNRGSALIVVLIIIVIGTVVIGLQFTPMKLSYVFGRQKRIQSELQLFAESGIAFAKSDLLRRTEFNAFDGDPGNAGSIPGWLPLRSGYSAAQQGLLGGTPTEFRIVQSKGDLRLGVAYFSDSTNPTYNSGNPDASFPRRYLVVSEATNVKSGEKFTTEMMMAVKFINFSEMSYGIVKPTLPPGMTEYVYFPATLDGWFHVGGTAPVRFVSDYNNPVHAFLSVVTFQRDTPSGDKYPFEMGNDVKVEFHKNYVDNYDLASMDYNALFEKAKAKRTLDLSLAPGDGGRICLLLSNDRIQRYDCKGDLYFPDVRYGGLQEEYLLTGPTVVYSDADIEVKGILDEFKVTVVSDHDIIIGGDIQCRDQSTSSRCRFGAIAKHDIVIPISVPCPGPTGWQCDDKSGGGCNFKLDGITNFRVATDRNRVNQASCNKGNVPSSLDLDGSYWAMNEVNVEGINDYIHSADGFTVAVWERAPADYSTVDYTTCYGPDPDLSTVACRPPALPGSSRGEARITFLSAADADKLTPQHIFKQYHANGWPMLIQDNNPTDGREYVPVHCWHPTEGQGGVDYAHSWDWPPPMCPPLDWTYNPPTREENPSLRMRGTAYNLMIYGSLISNDYFLSRAQWMSDDSGFMRKTVIADKANEVDPPVGFPNTNKPKETTLWSKSYNGGNPNTAPLH